MTAHLVIHFSNIGPHAAPDLNLNVEDWQEVVDDISLFVDTFEGCENVSVKLNAETGQGVLSDGRAGRFAIEVVSIFDPFERARKQAAEQRAREAAAHG